MTDEFWFRVEGYSTAYYNEWAEHEGDMQGPSTPHIQVREYPVIKHTPCGVRLAVDHETKFVNSSANKRFACPTVAEAYESFIARKRRQIKILDAQAARASDYLRLAEEAISKIESETV